MKSRRDGSTPSQPQRKLQSLHPDCRSQDSRRKRQNAAASGAQGQRTIWRQLLKRVAHRKLNQPRRAYSRENPPERPRIFNIVDGRVRKVCVVPDIEEIRREANGLLFCQFEVLDERKIPILLERSAVNVPAQI